MEKESICLNKYAKGFIIDVKNFETASKKAYSDMARHTLRIDADDKTKTALKKEVTKYLQKQVRTLDASNINQNTFDEWHDNICMEIMKIYHDRSYPFYYGQAQKWLNMLFKYLYVYNVKGYEFLFSDQLIKTLHMPIDTKVIKELHNKYNIKWPNSGWSKWDQDTYQSYQTNVREQLAQDTTLTEDAKLAFYWELIHWQNLN